MKKIIRISSRLTFILPAKIRICASILPLAVVFILASCTQKKDASTPSITTNSIYVVNEGSSNGSISYINKNTFATVVDIYSSVNTPSGGSPVLLGGQLQSMSIIGDKGYICVQSAGRVRIVDISTFVSKGEVSTGLSLSPRYIIAASNTVGYLTDWTSNNILVIDLNNNTLLSQITSTGVGPDFLFKYGSKAYVTYKGGYGTDNKVGVINTSTHAFEQTITVGASPSGIVSDANGKLWVVCSGAYNTSYSALQTTASLCRINPSTNTVELTLNFNDLDVSAIAGSLNINAAGNQLYYTFKGKTYKMDISATALPTTAHISRDFYGLSVDPANDQLIGCYAPSFTAAGRIIRYQPSGLAVDSFTVGVGPSRCVFY